MPGVYVPRLGAAEVGEGVPVSHEHGFRGLFGAGEDPQVGDHRAAAVDDDGFDG
jgi:hypothetical protein